MVTKMVDSNTYLTGTDELEKLFEAAAVSDGSALGELAEILTKAQPADCSSWDSSIRKIWEDGMQKFAERASLKQLDAAEMALVRAMLLAGLDGVIYRNLYSIWVKQVYASWKNPDGLVDALWLQKPTESLLKVGKHLKVLEAIQTVNARLKEKADKIYCFMDSFGIGYFEAINEMNSMVKIAFIKQQTAGQKNSGDRKVEHQILTLRNVLCNLMIIDVDCDVQKWLDKRVKPEKTSLAAMTAYINEHIISAQPPLLNPGRTLLVPLVMNEGQYKTLTSGVAPTAKAEDGNAAPAEQNDISGTKSWLQSRSLLELNERLKQVSAIEDSADADVANVLNLFNGAVAREDMVPLFAAGLAMLAHLLPESMKPGFATAIASLAEQKAVVWENDALFVEASDKIAGKLVVPWFAVTKQAKGVEYLIIQTLKMPCRLWSSTERNLVDANERAMLTQCVEDALAAGDVSADLVYWLWKSDKDDMKRRYLTNAPLLFRTLQKEVKGSYLKAHRDVFRLLMNDESFQRLVMDDGDEEKVTDFVRCVKRMPLLEAGDRQSLEVKIIRLYPEYKHLVEERKAIQQHVALPRITSWRSLKKRQLELKNLVEEQIPANADALEHARSLGDLRENSEYKFAKEQQALLGKTRKQYESSLVDLRGTDFHDVEVSDTVVLGSAVTVKFSGGRQEMYYVLGLLDTIPTRNMISFETPLGKLLIGRKLGERMEMPNGEHGQIIEISALPKEMIDWFNEEPVLGEE